MHHSPTLGAPKRRCFGISGLALCTLLACDGESTGPDCDAGGVADLAFDPGTTVVLHRIMGVEVLEVRAISECGSALALSPTAIDWSSDAPAVATAEAVVGAPTPLGLVRAVGFGDATISASARGETAELAVQVRRPETEASGFTILDSGHVAPYTTDLWVHGDFAYTGSQPWVCPGGTCEAVPGWLFTWALGPDGTIQKLDSLALPAPKINDVKVSADGALAVASLELGGAANGIAILDLADPASPAIVAHYTADLDHGVHNVWIERIEDREYVFVALPSGDLRGLHIVDITDPAAPLRVARFYGGSSIVHDVYVRDGLAFVSHWDAGLIILDAGNGIAGGSPDAPVEVGRLVTEGGHVHNAWFWPTADLVFVGEERFPSVDVPGRVGVMHVVDVANLAAPVEVARFGVPGETPHNFWLDEDRGILFAAWYDGGLRAIDVTGTLSGDLAAQGRDLGSILPSGERGAPSIWAPHLHDGVIYISDIYNGIWSVRFDG